MSASVIPSVGFTGTQRGMTSRQLENLYGNLVQLPPGCECHHGDCVGADWEFACLADALGLVTVSHPCDITSKRAFFSSTRILEVKKPLDRNRDIVHDSIIMIAAPGTVGEVLRSGTWATVRYARKLGRPLVVLDP